MRGVEQVHRAAEALRAAGRLAVELGHDRRARHPLRVRVAVLAVGRDDVVLGLERRERADARPPPGRCRGGGSRRSCPARRPSPAPPRCAGWPASGGSSGRAGSCRGCGGPGGARKPHSRLRSLPRFLRAFAVFGRRWGRRGQEREHIPRAAGVRETFEASTPPETGRCQANDGSLDARGSKMRPESRPAPDRRFAVGGRRTEPRPDSAGRRRAGDRPRLRADAGRRRLHGGDRGRRARGGARGARQDVRRHRQRHRHAGDGRPRAAARRARARSRRAVRDR